MAVPRFGLHAADADPAALARRVEYPCVLKPLRLSASRGVIRADGPTDFVAAFRRVAAILAEPDVAACGEPARQLPCVVGHAIDREWITLEKGSAFTFIVNEVD